MLRKHSSIKMATGGLFQQLIWKTFLVIRNYSVTIAIVLIPLYATSCETRARHCHRHPLMQRQSLSLNRIPPQGLVNIIHGNHHWNHRHIRNLSDVDSIYIRREVIRVIGENLCPVLSDAELNIIDTCPSYDVLEYDENRMPPVIRQVKCRCPTCLGPFSDEGSRCEPVYTSRLVLRVVGCDASNHYEYAQVWEPKSIGCECRTSAESGERRNNYVMPP